MATTLQLDTKAIVTGVVCSLVVGGVLGALGYSRVVELSAFRLDSQAIAIDKINTTIDNKLVTKEVYEVNQRRIEEKLDAIIKEVTDIKRTVK